jgi:hypothetical protein
LLHFTLGENMCILSNLAAAGNSSLIPDHTISPPRLLEWAEAETEAAEQYMRTVASAAGELPETVRQRIYDRAVDNIKDSPLALGTAGFDAWAISARAVPFLLWLSVRVRHPSVTRNQVAGWLNGPRGREIARAVWDLWGYGDEKKVTAGSSACECGQPCSESSSQPESHLRQSAD